MAPRNPTGGPAPVAALNRADEKSAAFEQSIRAGCLIP